MNIQQQQKAAQEINNRLERVTMSWNNELRQWHPVAIKALQFASCSSLQIPQKLYSKLLETNTHGINMNIVAVLANNLEMRTPNELGMLPETFADVLELNQTVADQWEALCGPVREQVIKGIELEAAKPKIHHINGQS